MTSIENSQIVNLLIIEGVRQENDGIYKCTGKSDDFMYFVATAKLRVRGKQKKQQQYVSSYKKCSSKFKPLWVGEFGSDIKCVQNKHIKKESCGLKQVGIRSISCYFKFGPVMVS